MWIYKLKL